MPINLYRKVRFSNADIVGPYKEYLYGAVGERITADIRVNVSWASEEVPLEFVSGTNSIERLDGGSFIADGFEDGDGIAVLGTALNNFALAPGTLIVTESTLYVPSGIADETITANIYGTTPITSIDFYPNLIENNSGFNLFNLTDRETIPRYSADTISLSSASKTLMQITTNSRGWVSPAESVIGATTSATIYKDPSLSAMVLGAEINQVFIISHTFTITPLFLSNQLDILKKGLPPAAGKFKDRYALKYIYTVDAKFDPLNPDIPHTTDGEVEFPKGQTGWYNEYVNGRPSLYSAISVKYENVATGAVISSIDYCAENQITIGIRGPSFTTDSLFILHILYLPLDESEYVNTRTDYKTNFVYERAFFQNIGVVVQGSNTGDYHFLKDVSSTSLNITDAQIRFKVEFSDELKEFFNSKGENDRNYLIFVTTNNVSTIIDVNTYQCNKDDSSLFQVIDEWQFLGYPHCNGVGYSNFSLLPRDTVLSKGQFYIKQGTSDAPVVLKNISANIIVTNSEVEFPLETFSINTAGTLPNCDNIQQISFEQDRDFILSSQDCRNTISLVRVPTLDISGYNAYEFIYPFKARWEEWRPLEGASNCFSFPTQNWFVYTNASGWSVKFSIKASVEQNGYTTDFEHIVWGEIKDPCVIESSADFETFDITGTREFMDVIAKDQDTLVRATVYGDFSGYTEDQLYGILSLDAWGVGGIAYTQEIGTRMDVDNDFIWYGDSGSLRAKLVKISDTKVELSAYINHTLLPTDTDEFIFSARIGEYTTDISSACENLENLMVEFYCAELDIVEVGDADTIIVYGSANSNGVRDVSIEDLVLVRLTDSSWNVTGGFIGGKEVISGTVTGVMQSSPAHPYNNSLVGASMLGELSGQLYLDELICAPMLDFRAFNDGEQHLFNDLEEMLFN